MPSAASESGRVAGDRADASPPTAAAVRRLGPRIHSVQPLQPQALVTLDDEAARHVQVLRLQPGDALVVFDGRGGEYAATVQSMGRREVQLAVGAHRAYECEPPRALHLAVGMPANERMDWLVEKATELGAASVQPLLTERTVLRLEGERARKRQAHWQAIAVAACEQCGRNRVPRIEAVRTLREWLADGAHGDTAIADPARPAAAHWLLSLDPQAQTLAPEAGAAAVWVLVGPEGGLSAAEEGAAYAQGWRPASLGARVLRAETAALAALVRLNG